LPNTTRVISERTKAALAAAKQRGVKIGGYRGTTIPKTAVEAASRAIKKRADAMAADLAPNAFPGARQGGPDGYVVCRTTLANNRQRAAEMQAIVDQAQANRDAAAAANGAAIGAAIINSGHVQ
jgi:DNA invertase Pin-like site-specific DNA recombinase